MLAVGLVVLALLPMLMGDPDVIWLVWGFLLASFIWFEAGRALQRRQSAVSAADTQCALAHASGYPATGRPAREPRVCSDWRKQGPEPSSPSGRDGAALGIVNEAAVAALPEHRRPWVNLAAVARSVPPKQSINADLMGEDLVNEIANRLTSEYLVVESDGRIYGVLAAADVESALTSELSKR